MANPNLNPKVLKAIQLRLFPMEEKWCIPILTKTELIYILLYNWCILYFWF